MNKSLFFLLMCGLNQSNIFSAEIESVETEFPTVRTLSKQEQAKVLKYDAFSEFDIHHIECMILACKPGEEAESAKIIYLSTLKELLEYGAVYKGNLDSKDIYYFAPNMREILQEKREEKQRSYELWKQVIKERQEKKSCYSSICVIL